MHKDDIKAIQNVVWNVFKTQFEFGYAKKATDIDEDSVMKFIKEIRKNGYGGVFK